MGTLLTVFTVAPKETLVLTKRNTYPGFRCRSHTALMDLASAVCLSVHNLGAGGTTCFKAACCNGAGIKRTTQHTVRSRRAIGMEYCA